MKIKAFGLSDVGRKREKNEDSFVVNESLGLCVVADGMGGHQGGEYASRLAALTVEEVIKSLEEDPEATIPDEGVSVNQGEYQAYLRYAVRLAGQRIYEKASSDIKLRGMGTTVVIVMLRDGKAYIANVGDSRTYRIRGTEIKQMTKDHSLVGEQIRAGMITEEDARIHKFKNIITRSVGFQEEVEVDVDIRVLREGDRFLLCSDGLSNMIRSNELLDIVQMNDVETACHRLIDFANERGGDDNITAVLLEVQGLDVVVSSSSNDSGLDLEEDATELDEEATVVCEKDK